MKKILFLSSNKAYLPEIEAYIAFFSTRGWTCFDARKMSEYRINDFDLLWFFMGTSFKRYDIPTVHEYASLSINPFAQTKNQIKRVFNANPSLRIFLNEKIQQEFSFTDSVPFLYRDMGVAEQFFVKQLIKEYDFVYVGEINERRNSVNLLKKFKNCLKGQRLLVIGAVPDNIFREYKSVENIIFTGKVSYSEVPYLASKAEYAINYIPNTYPYCYQTSTKLLEYVAMNLKVITTDYHWVNSFEQKNKLRFYKIKEDLSDLDPHKIASFQFINRDMKDFCWENILKKSLIAEHVSKICNS